MKIHELKTWPTSFARLCDGTKTAELRENDRGFCVGDVLLLQEFDPLTREYSGAERYFIVTLVTTPDESAALARRFVMLSLAPFRRPRHRVATWVQQ